MRYHIYSIAIYSIWMVGLQNDLGRRRRWSLTELMEETVKSPHWKQPLTHWGSTLRFILLQFVLFFKLRFTFVCEISFAFSFLEINRLRKNLEEARSYFVLNQNRTFIFFARESFAIQRRDVFSDKVIIKYPT